MNYHQPCDQPQPYINGHMINKQPPPQHMNEQPPPYTDPAIHDHY